MSSVAIVTDSTADLPRALVEQAGIRTVPLTVAFDDEVFVPGVSITSEEFYGRLAGSEVTPTTAQPSPAAFDDMFAACANDGHDAAVAIHCSSELSGTFAVAQESARRAPIPVEVVDSRLVGGALGLCVLAAQRAADSGGDLPGVLEAARRVREQSIGLLVVDTLEYLRKGGRLTGAQAAVGTALRVKPVLELRDGRVEVRERTRTWSRAMECVAAAVEGLAGTVDIVVVHAAAPQRADGLARMIAERVEVRDRIDATIGPIVGTHVGPGAIGVAAMRT